MMEVDSKTSTLAAVHMAVEKNLDTPWYLVDLVRVLVGLNFDVIDLMASVSSLNDQLDLHRKALEGLKAQYSEILYHMKSSD